MTPNDLAAEVDLMAARAKSRIRTVGADQYYRPADGQLFERLPLAKLFEYAYEELEDMVNYCTMLHIRLRRLEAATARNLFRSADEALEYARKAYPDALAVSLYPFLDYMVAHIDGVGFVGPEGPWS